MAKKSSSKGNKKVAAVMHEWGAGELNIGKSKKKVPHTKAGQKQAIAIALKKAGKSRKK